MLVLFLSSGNKNGVPTYLVFNQGESLKSEGVNIEYFTICGKGLFGYLQNVPRLAKHLKANSYHVVHAHYSHSGFVASLALFIIHPKRRPKLIVSLLGSDAYAKGWTRVVIKFLHWISWKTTIVKTAKMKQILRLSKAIVIPNGVDIKRFKPIEMKESKELLDINLNRRIIAFVADPKREEKNFALAKEAFNLLELEDVELLPVYNISNALIPFYLNAADVLLLTSKWEGSVNVVKEAMACNLPIVSTDVGDVKMNTKGLDGCYISSNNSEDIANNIEKALVFNNRTKGRERLVELCLDSVSVANKLISVYKEVLKN